MTNVFNASELSTPSAAKHPALSQAIIDLLNLEPGFVAPLLQSRLTLMASGTAGVRQGEMQLCMAFLLGLSKGQRQTLLAHEALHLLLRHPERMGAFIEAMKGRYSESEIVQHANSAMDCGINNMLLLSNFERINGWTTYHSLFPARVNSEISALTRLSWEQLAIILMDIARANRQAAGPRPERLGDAQTWGNVAPISGDELEEAQLVPVEKAQFKQQRFGNLFDKEFPALSGNGANMQRLKDFITSRARYDLTWAKLPRRPSAYPMQGKRKAGIGEIIIAVDISSSMPQESVNKIFAQVNLVAEDIMPERIVLVPFNDMVGDVVTLGCGEFLPACPTPHGGTDFAGAFDEIAKHDDGYCPVIILTDMDCDYPAEPAFANRLIWVGIRSVDKNPPYGDYVDLD